MPLSPNLKKRLDRLDRPPAGDRIMFILFWVVLVALFAYLVVVIGVKAIGNAPGPVPGF